MDYMLKGGMDAHTLERVLRTALECNTLAGLTDMLRDQVTGLYTRDGFLTVGRRRLEEAMRAASSLVLICVLFENLQALRDAFGPGTADRALNDVAGLLKGCCRRSDVVGRLGEAQFVILGVDAVAPSAEVMRNRLAAVLLIGVTGYGCGMIFAFQQTPDTPMALLPFAPMVPAVWVP